MQCYGTVQCSSSIHKGLASIHDKIYKICITIENYILGIKCDRRICSRVWYNLFNGQTLIEHLFGTYIVIIARDLRHSKYSQLPRS